MREAVLSCAHCATRVLWCAPASDSDMQAGGQALLDETPTGRVIRFEVPDDST